MIRQAPSYARILLLGLLLAATSAELWRLADRRHLLQERTRVNQREAQSAVDAQALVAGQGDAVRDLILATTPGEIDDAEGRFETLLRRHDDAQSVLQALFAADPETTAQERALLARIRREQIAAVEPVQRVVSLARRNEDASATRLLVEQALPHENELQKALAELAALESAQNHALERGSDTRSLEMALMGLLGALASVLAVAIRRHAVRARPSPGTAGGAEEAAADEAAGVQPARRVDIDVSADERARALVIAPASRLRVLAALQGAGGASGDAGGR